MEIVFDNYNEVPATTFDTTCEHCGSILRIDGNDLHSGEWGLLYFDCPLCGKQSYIDGAEEELTCDTVVYPDNWSIGKMTIDGKRLATDDDLLKETKPYLSKAIKALYETLKDVEIDIEDDNEVCRRYYTGRTMLIMSKSINSEYIYGKSRNKYDYDLQVVKPLAVTTVYDNYNKTTPNNN